jgi:hypothetical protein
VLARPKKKFEASVDDIGLHAKRLPFSLVLAEGFTPGSDVTYLATYNLMEPNALFNVAVTVEASRNKDVAAALEVYRGIGPVEVISQEPRDNGYAYLVRTIGATTASIKTGRITCEARYETAALDDAVTADLQPALDRWITELCASLTPI